MAEYNTVLVTGQRGWNDWWTLRFVLDTANPVTLIEGAADGADEMAHLWAAKTMPTRYLDWRAQTLPVWPGENCRFPVYDEDWRRSRGAGMQRNRAMLNYLASFPGSNAVIAFIDEARLGPSKGTKACIRDAYEYDADVWVFPRDIHLWLPENRLEAWEKYRKEGKFGAVPRKSHPRERN